MDKKSVAPSQDDSGKNRDDFSPKAVGHSIRKTVALKTFEIVNTHCPDLAIEESLVTDYLKENVAGTVGEVPEDFLSHAFSQSGLPHHLREDLLEQFAFAAGLRFPFLGFADRMAVPIDFYTQEGDIAELCRILQTPVLQEESGCFLTLASINPLTAEALAAEIVRIFRSRSVVTPVIFPVRTGFESWQSLCRRHFAS